MDSHEKHDTDEDEFQLAEFVDDRSSLFVVMGVFAGLGIYISQTTTASLSESSLLIQSGFVASFGLALLMLSLVYDRLCDEFGSYHNTLMAHFQRDHVDLLVFSLLISVLMVSVINILGKQDGVIFILLITAAMFITMGLLLRALYAIAKALPYSPYWRVGSLFFGSLLLLGVSAALRFWVVPRLAVVTLGEFSLSSPTPVLATLVLICVATMQTFGSIGLLASIVAVPLILFDKFRGVSPYDE